MTSPLLVSKLNFPLLHDNLVPRQRLVEQLNNGLKGALILVSAPPGYGKTTLVSQWLRSARQNTAWLSLDDGDNDPTLFLACLVASLQKVDIRFGDSLLEALQAMQPPSAKARMSVLINFIAERDDPVVLVFDDFHVIHAPPILEMISFLVENAPPQLHLALLSRTDPPLPLSRLRVRNQLTEIRLDQLRFTRDEINSFMNEVMDLELSDGDITAMESRTEGWIAGLQLASIAMRSHLAVKENEDIHEFVSAFTGSHFYVIDYLVEEVLQYQPQGVKSFLLQTSILDRMCAKLCEAVVESEDIASVNSRFDGQAMLESLEQMNLFLIPLDNERGWYRYHHLFADVLRQRLKRELPPSIPDLHWRASLWYEDNGFISEATQHALASGDRDRAAQLIEQNGCDMLIRGEITTLQKFIEVVDPYTQTIPWLAVQKAWVYTLTGQFDLLDPILQTAEQLASKMEPGNEVKTIRGAIASARAYRANVQSDTPKTVELSQQALDYLSDSTPFSCGLRSWVTSILGDASWTAGDLGEATEVFTRAVEIGQASGNRHLLVIANNNLASILLEQGYLHPAERIFSETLKMASGASVEPSQAGYVSPLVEDILAGLCRISYEWNHLDDARKYARQCIQLCRWWENPRLQSVGYTVLAWIEHVQENHEGCREMMQAVEDLVSEGSLSIRYASWVKNRLACLWIAQGDPERAALFLQKYGIETISLPAGHRIPNLVTLHLLLAGEDYSKLLDLSEQMLHEIDPARHLGMVIETLVLRSLAHQGRNDREQALATLNEALTLAQSEGFARVFLDEGAPMLKLLHLARAQKLGGGYASELLAGIATGQRETAMPNRQLIEPLSPRELEVLQLIESGRSNQDIAEKLVISLPTVKRHISNIYAKLGARSRTQAISLARELGIL